MMVRDGTALGHAEYFAELIDECAPEADPNATLYRLGAAVVDSLVGEIPVERLARYFEFWGPASAGCLSVAARLSSVRRRSGARRADRPGGCGVRVHGLRDWSGDRAFGRVGPVSPGGGRHATRAAVRYRIAGARARGSWSGRIDS